LIGTAAHQRAGDVDAMARLCDDFTAANYAVQSHRAAHEPRLHGLRTPDTIIRLLRVNSGKIFVMESIRSRRDPVAEPAQWCGSNSCGSFTTLAERNLVISLTGHSACGTVSGVPKASSVSHHNGSGASLTYDENFCTRLFRHRRARNVQRFRNAGIDHHRRLQPGGLPDGRDQFRLVSDVMFCRGRRAQTRVLHIPPEVRTPLSTNPVASE